MSGVEDNQDVVKIKVHGFLILTFIISASDAQSEILRTCSRVSFLTELSELINLQCFSVASQNGSSSTIT